VGEGLAVTLLRSRDKVNVLNYKIGICKSAVVYSGEQTVLAVHFLSAVPWRQKLRLLNEECTARKDID